MRTTSMIWFPVGGIMIGGLLCIVARSVGHEMDPVQGIAWLTGITAFCALLFQESDPRFTAFQIALNATIAALMMTTDLRLAAVLLTLFGGAIGVISHTLINFVPFSGNARFKQSRVRMIAAPALLAVLNALVLWGITGAFTANGYSYPEVSRDIWYPFIVVALVSTLLTASMIASRIHRVILRRRKQVK